MFHFVRCLRFPFSTTNSTFSCSACHFERLFLGECGNIFVHQDCIMSTCSLYCGPPKGCITWEYRYWLYFFSRFCRVFANYWAIFLYFIALKNHYMYSVGKNFWFVENENNSGCRELQGTNICKKWLSLPLSNIRK